MTRRFFKVATGLVFIFTALGIGALVLFPSTWESKKLPPEEKPRIIIPRNTNPRSEETINQAEYLAREDNNSSWAALSEGDVIVSILTGYFEGGLVEKQFVAYRSLLEIESPIYLTFIDYDDASGSYMRQWTSQTAATRPGTISLYAQDLLGDRSTCVLLYGMNSASEHTLTVFHLNTPQRNLFQSRENTRNDLYSKIAELRIDGTITVRETERSQAYQSGVGRGQSFTISTFGRDFESSNILDQIEIVYAYNEGNGLFEQSGMTRIPGSQVEQRRVRELLSDSKMFEDFITGLWYHITPQGTIDRNQYIYFDPPSKEIIFYGDETQQVFSWVNSIRTRYGLYVSSQNISVTTLRRSIDLELESLDGIRVRVIEDVRLKIGVNAPWDGSYRKAFPLETRYQSSMTESAHFDAWYDGSIGKVNFQKNGSYEINAVDSVKQGKYAFFNYNNQEMLELRPDGFPASQREVYLVEGERNQAKTITLNRVRLGARGIERLHERPVSLTVVLE